jgi:predicted site-specific integrase-resolvase
MADNEKTLSTAEFSQQTGIAVSTITHMLRQGKIRGEKRSGKWAIFASEISNQAVAQKKDQAKPAALGPGPIFETSTGSPSAYDIDTFARMTFLTEQGIRRWLKTGRLSGRIEANGKALVDADNLSRPELQHLIRK